MSRSKEEMILLDEKIARIRKKNEEIMRRKQLIDEEIELAKKQNALVNTKPPKFEDDFGPTLYSDTLDDEQKCKNSIINDEYLDYEQKKNITSKNSSGVGEAEWRAERKQIDNERIRRQKGDSGWRREWDADKIIEDGSRNSERNRTSAIMNRNNQNENTYEISKQYLFNNENTRCNRIRNYTRTTFEDDWNTSKTKKGTEFHSSHYEPPSRRISTPNDKNTEYQSLNLRGNTNDCESSSYDVKPKIQTSERNRKPPNIVKPLTHNSRHMFVDNNSSNITNNTSNQQKVSWDNNNKPEDSDEVDLKGDIKNIVIRIQKDQSEDRMIRVIDECKVLATTEKRINRFDETQSLDIKDCVAKMTTLRVQCSQNNGMSSNKQETNIKIPPSEPNYSKVKKLPSYVKNMDPISPAEKKSAQHDSFTEAHNFAQDSSKHHEKQKYNNLKENIPKSSRKENGIVDYDNDEEWEDVSGEEWEDVSEEE